MMESGNEFQLTQSPFYGDSALSIDNHKFTYSLVSLDGVTRI